jgi:hypothetical protein
MIFFHSLTSNNNTYFNLFLFQIKFEYSLHKFHLLLYCSYTNIQIIAIICIDDMNIIELSNYKLTKLQSYSFILFTLYIIWYCNHHKKQILFIETKYTNYKALSLYTWIGCHLIQQRSKYYVKENIHGISLFLNKIQTKNLWRRFLILKI